LVVFGLMYGRQAYSLTEDLKCSVQQAQEYINSFFARYPKYAKWWKDVQKDAIETGLLTTRFGRRRRWKLITPQLEQHIRNQAVNFPIQSTASDVCLTALIQLEKELPKREWGNLLFPVHDSLEFELEPDYLTESVPYIIETMEYPFGRSGQRFPVDFKVGKSMGELEDWNG